MKHKIARFTFALLALSLLLTSPRAQQATQSSEDRIALYQALLDLTNPWTVMCVAAHPDDEDGTSLIVMRRKYGAHTVSLFSTFGEGGQNAIGPELYEELGAIRARETMAAAEIQGSEPHFLGLKDFGYSKTRDEAFKFWGHEEGLRRMVLEIRKLRPDVIITNHSTQGPWPKTFAEYANRFRAFSGQQGGAPGQLPMIRYALVKSANGANSLSKGAHNFLEGLQLPERVAEQLAAPTIDGKPLTNF